MLKLDHIAFGVSDHAAASDAMRRLGFVPTPTCRCEWTQAGRDDSAAACSVVLEGEYFDFIEVDDPAWRARAEGNEVYAQGIVPTGIVISGRAIAGVRAALAGTDRAVEPYPITRTLPAGSGQARIDYQFLPVRSLGLPLALIEDPSPDTLRRSAWLAHPNGATAIDRVHLRVPSVEMAIASWAASPFAPERKAGAPRSIDLGRARIELHATPFEGYLETVSRLLPDLERSALLALEVNVTSLASVKRCLNAGAVGFADAQGAVTVDARQGFGTGFIFREV